MKKLLRCFVAIELPDEIKKELAKIQKFLKEKNVFEGKYAGVKNLHLTLKFLGGINAGEIEKVKNRLGKIRIKKFNIELKDLGLFPMKKRGGVFKKFNQVYKKVRKVMWVGANNPSLKKLKKEIDESLKDLFEKEVNFKGHITLARIYRIKNKEKFEGYFKSLKIHKKKFLVEKFFLKKSELSPEGSSYKTLKEFGLEA